MASGPVWVGLANHQAIYRRFNFWGAVYNTFYFAAVSIPLAIILLAFALALMLNAKIRGQVVYRTIYFLPTLVPE